MTAPAPRSNAAQIRSGQVRSSLSALFVAQALSTGATTVGIALSSILIVHLTRSEELSGLPSTLKQVSSALSAAEYNWNRSRLPSTLKQVSSALAALIIGGVMARSGRRLGLALSYLIAALGALIGGFSALGGSLWGFLLGVMLLGVGDGGIPQGRYAVAELVKPSHRGRTVGYLLSFGVLGSVLSTSLTPLLQNIAAKYELPSLELGWLLGGVLLFIGMVLISLFLRAAPLELVQSGASKPLEQAPKRNPWQLPDVRLSLIALSIGQGVMVMMMVLTPLHAKHLGHGLPTISSLISAHLAGMFGLAWLTGNLVDRYGERRFIALGAVLLASSAVLAFFVSSAFLIGVSLFVLGLGWNWCYVAGSSLLTNSLSPLERSKIQGQTEFAVWGAAALGSLAGGFVVGRFGFGALCVLATGVSLVPLLALLRLKGPRAMVSAAQGD